MDIKINGEIIHTEVILISNTEEFYFFKYYQTDKEFAISKNNNIEINRNYKSIFKRGTINQEPFYKTKKSKKIIKKKM